MIGEPGAGSREPMPEGGEPAAGSRDPMPRKRRKRAESVTLLQLAAVYLAAVIAIGFVAVLVLSGTDWGHERVRRLIVSQLAGVIHGQVTVGRVRGNLLTGATVDNFAIRDSAGQPFVAAREISANYTIAQLLRRKIDLRNVHIVDPTILIDKPPAGKWNYQRIFPPADTTKPQSVRGKGFPWIVFRDVTIINGHLVVRAPWKPDTTLSLAAQDSSIREALGGGKRIMVREYDGPTAGRGGRRGFQKIVELRDVIARAPLVRITQPGFKDRLAQIASLQMDAYPFRPPSAIVRNMVGAVRFNNDSVWWSDVAVRMPGSALRGSGTYALNSGDLTLQSRAKPLALADFRFVFPRLPSEGGGPLDFWLKWKGTTQEYIVRNADVRSRGARLQGKFAISFADTFAIHDTDLRFANVSTTLIEQVSPDFKAPRRGTLDGSMSILGGRGAMRLAGNVAFHDQLDGTSAVAGSGIVGFQRGGEWRLRDVQGRLQPLQVALLKSLSPSLAQTIAPIGGVVVGTVTVNGSTRTGLAMSGDVEHRDRGGVSNVTGRVGVSFGGIPRFDADLKAHSLALGEVGLLAPAAGLRGAAAGPIKVSGTLDNLRLNTSLAVSGGGAVSANGRLDLHGATKSYDLTGRARLLNLNAVMASAPRTSLTASVRANGSGFQLATIRGALAADFSASTWDSVKVDSGSVRVAVANGVARVDRLFVMGANTRAEAAGTFGLAPGRSGELRYSVAVDSLSAYNRWIPGAADTGVVRPRPLRIATALTKAHEDSVRVAKATEVERAATGKAMPRIVVDTPSALARNALAGKLYAAGTLRGNIRNFDLRGRLSADNLIARGNSAKSLRAEYAWLGVRSGKSTLALGVDGNDISVKGFAFDTLQGRLSYKHPNGEIQLAVRQSPINGKGDRAYAVRGTFALGGNKQLRVDQLALRMDTTVWRLAHAAEFRSRPTGLEVSNVELRSNNGGLVYLNGTLPTQGNANLVLDVRNFQVADITTFLQSDLPLQGVLTARGVVEGTMADPRFRGAAGFVNGTYNGSVIPDFQSTFRYAGASLTTHVEALRKGGTPSVIADATLPINLALSGVTGARLLDVPMHVDVSGDSLPLDLIPVFTDAVAQMRGTARGSFTMRGTLQRPVLAGALTWANGSMRIVPTGVLIENIAAAVRMARDTVFVDSIAGRAGTGDIRMQGRLYVGNWREPAFDLHVVGNDARVLDNDRGKIDADVGLSLTGPFNDAYAAGLINVRSGVMYLPETHGKKVINAGDPAVFAVLDTAITNDRELFPTSSPLLENLRIDVDVTVNRNTWVRSRDANIEMYTEEPVRVHRERDALALTGVVSTDRGEYTFLSKRFQIKRGSATFVGGPELNPTLQATGEYEVVVAGRPNFNIRVLIGGTAQKPKLTLESDAQPPISQSDLLSYLAFGRSTSSLLQVEGSGLSGSTATGNLIGVGAALATKRLAAVALGVMADEVEGEATKGLGADVFNITPSDVPTELGAVGSFLQGTKVEAGKYLSPYFFMAFQTQLQLNTWPGMRAQYRTPKGWRFEGAIEPRYILEPPALAIQPIAPKSSFGANIIREWRF